jgi:hypothetical protein
LLAAILIMPGCGGGSGPTVFSDPADALRVYDGLVPLFGDPHVHTNLSDGDESPDFALRYARDVSRLDWCCITDHAEYLVDHSQDVLDYYRSLPDKYEEQGRFMVLFGYEWTSTACCHRNVYSTETDIPIYPSNGPESDTIEELWALLSGYEIMTVPHHPIVAASQTWWKHLNPEVERCVEFYSKWGLSLRTDNPRPVEKARPWNSVMAAIGQAGRRYGLIAGSDTHMSRPGSVLEETRQEGALPYAQPGITCVWAGANTRQAIFDALRSRRCYGVTGTRVVLEFTVNSQIMGSEITSSQPPVIAFRVSSEAEIREVQVLKLTETGAEEIRKFAPGALDFEGRLVDLSFNNDAGYTLCVVLANTDMALASPVWVDRIVTDSPI